MMNRIFVFVAVAVLTLTLSTASFSETPAKAEPPKTVSLEMTDITVAEAFQNLFKNTKLSYIVQPGVTGTISDLRLKEVSFDSALNSIAKVAGLEVSKEDGIYIISKSTPKPEAAESSVLVKAESKPETTPQTQTKPTAETPVVETPVIEVPQEVMIGQYQENYPVPPAYQPGPQEPVYYGNYPNQGYYVPRYRAPYPYMMNPPAYQTYRPNVLPQPGSAWSAGIGKLRLIKPGDDNKK